MNPETLQRTALDVAAALDPSTVLRTIVDGLASEPGVALARIWLIGPGDVCETCSFAAECHRRDSCLHLAASAGESLTVDSNAWTETEGTFRRFPMGVRKVGLIGASGVGRLHHVTGDDRWVAQPDWAHAEGIASFGGQPLIFRGEVLGVLAIFSRTVIEEGPFGWLRTFADQAAVSIANARAFTEVQRLREQLELERDYLREEIKVERSIGSIVGESEAIKNVARQIELVASTEATVLIEGESGTGKELVASALHEQSPRSAHPLVRVNCASIPHELFESEFFGHHKGSFTGALRDRAGRFQVADGGTLFLDEVGEIPLDLQGKLLRALQEGKFSRVGEDTEREVDVRVIAATNRDLATEVRAGRFREDLYYRLSVFPIRVPALRERRGDVPLLARHFVETSRVISTSPRPRLRNKDLSTLSSYPWPGNVRELQNVIERGLIGARSGHLAITLPSSAPQDDGEPAPMHDQAQLATYAELTERERANVVAVLDHCRWKVSGPDGAAEFLGVKPATLHSRLKAMGIQRPRRTQSAD